MPVAHPARRNLNLANSIALRIKASNMSRSQLGTCGKLLGFERRPSQSLTELSRTHGSLARRRLRKDA